MNVCISVHLCESVCVYLCGCRAVCVCMFVSMKEYMYMYVCVSVCVCMYAYLCVYVYNDVTRSEDSLGASSLLPPWNSGLELKLSGW